MTSEELKLEGETFPSLELAVNDTVKGSANAAAGGGGGNINNNVSEGGRQHIGKKRVLG
ncbi:hypothetical protein Pmar_PMAR022135 [Perkinsus marinus ATCC 50983]|uniref:Uncharacterized protein n=1 Tax=Perkinsus marinus (strain ATCC 50983 / TXsc) TaxID=423536 RepID=C5L0P5_PERM5|nr:hypothetical protein Pmar_PMAR022135 [Perkinsus marinus ATCC 50983]EER09697.1 hypothetical protein Pmar_PMAR022135 [Perkinsus marinus ATCC 50983]|eukprot:XP_002777902.1 hypothetical protein Pmar_PMAR022135 [Perkinsus marinus ATCC 50983]